MSDLNLVADFFNYIAPKVRELVLSFEGKAAISVQKKIGDYATEVDIAVENLVVAEIQKRFPGDLILAEEGYADTEIPAGRIWIIDPICGTTNVGRGIMNFCTNIALADNSKLVASCVVDHSQTDYFWSVGDKKVYVNDRLYEAISENEGMGVLIDVDLGCLPGLDTEIIKRHSEFMQRLLTNTNYITFSLNSSLGFAYSAVGKVDGFINLSAHPWDICAASFLVQQSGGIITDLTGAPWEISSAGTIAARNATIHEQLLAAYRG